MCYQIYVDVTGALNFPVSEWKSTTPDVGGSVACLVGASGREEGLVWLSVSAFSFMLPAAMPTRSGFCHCRSVSQYFLSGDRRV